MAHTRPRNSSGINPVIRIGVAIPAHNRVDRTRECLSSLADSSLSGELFVVLVDDGSSDGTSETVRREFPDVTLLRGDGSLWWSGATNLALVECLERSCDYVLLLNQDCVVWPDAIDGLLKHALGRARTICAAVTVDLDAPDRVLWAGTEWGPVRRLPLVFQARSLVPIHTPVAELPPGPLPCDMTGGRGLLVPASAFKEIGLFDARALPHYGADNDFALRARRAGYQIHVVTNAFVGTRRGDSTSKRGAGRRSLVQRMVVLLFSRRHGAIATVWWTLATRHTPVWAAVPTYCRMLGLALKGAWIESRRDDMRGGYPGV